MMGGRFLETISQIGVRLCHIIGSCDYRFAILGNPGVDRMVSAEFAIRDARIARP